MIDALKQNRAAWLAAGVLLGLVAAGWLPHSPAHAVATDRLGDFAIATGPLDSDLEAIYFLDCLTGDLRAAVLNPYTWKFYSQFQTNVIEYLGVDASKNPRYLLVGPVIFGDNIRNHVAAFVNLRPESRGRVVSFQSFDGLDVVRLRRFSHTHKLLLWISFLNEIPLDSASLTRFPLGYAI